MLVQFLADALVFPLPLATKNWWDGFANAPIIAPAFEITALVSLTAYGIAAFRRYLSYRLWLESHRTDGADFDPSWVRNFLIALAGVAVVWLGFVIANWIDPSRNYFDQFWLYVIFSGLVIYLGVAGWRHAETSFPRPTDRERDPVPLLEPGRNWADQGRAWLQQIAKSLKEVRWQE